ncbi:MAG TPA: hypothetical protein VGR00_02520, partial [Thermoanaerobaculia bacterium]|nr:hypothetical protein [Thermoanaerobaculia bacterium]
MPPRPEPSLEPLRQEIAAAGGTLTRTRLVLGSGLYPNRTYERAFRRLGVEAPRALLENGDVLSWRVSGRVDLAAGAAGSGGPADLYLDSKGRLTSFSWSTGGELFSLTSAHDETEKARESFLLALREKMRGDRESVGQENAYLSNNVPVRVLHLKARPGEPPRSLVLVRPPGTAALTDELGDPDALRNLSGTRGLHKVLVSSVPVLLLVGTVVVLFVVLAVKKRLSFRIALPLSLLAFVSMLIGGFVGDSDVGGVFVQTATLLAHFASIAFLIAFWSVAESLLRDTVPGFTTSLDALAAGRIGPRAGRALLSGLG